MKKRILGSILAAALVITQAVSVFAAGSKTADITLDKDFEEHYEIVEGTEETFAYLGATAPEVKDKLLAVNKGGEKLESIPEIKDAVKDKSMVSEFFQLDVVEEGVKTEDGKYKVSFNVPDLTKATKDVQLVQYNTEKGTWEVLKAVDVDYKNKTVTFEVSAAGPMAIVADVEESSGSGEGTGDSPQTGVTSNWMLWIGAAAVLLGAAVVLRKKSRA